MFLTLPMTDESGDAKFYVGTQLHCGNELEGVNVRKLFSSFTCEEEK